MANLNIDKIARLADVAREAGVSQGTVSNVFNKPELVREEVRDRVREAARKLGYRGPDPRGRVLRAGKVNAIGVTTTNQLSYFFTDPFVRVLMTGVTEAAGAHGVGVSLVSAASEDELAWSIRNALVDGLILFCLDDATRLIALARERQLPFVALSLSEFDATVPAVGIDNVGGARRAAEHLIGIGHRRFAVLTFKLTEREEGRVALSSVDSAISSTMRDRITGYVEAFTAAGIDPESVPIYEAEKNVEAALEQIFAAPEKPTAILAQADKIAFRAMDWLTAHGYDIPRDVSIVGFDGVPESAATKPPLTTMAQQIAEIGRRAVGIILEDGAEVRHETVAVDLVVRGSTAPPRR